MFTAMMTWLSLLNQEITESYPPAMPTTFSRLNTFCGGCTKRVGAFKCSVYTNPTKLMWFRNNQQCAFNFKTVAKKEKVVNALKASKRAAKGK